MLSKDQAVEIYKLKLSLQNQLGSACSPDSWRLYMRGKCVPVSKMYGVSPRTIRDIWNRSTWGFATIQLWVYEQASETGISESCSSSLKVFPVPPA